MGPEIVVPIIVLVVGTIGALGWWQIAAKAAPYKDEVGKPRKTKPNQPKPTVIKGFGESKSGPQD